MGYRENTGEREEGISKREEGTGERRITGSRVPRQIPTNA